MVELAQILEKMFSTLRIEVAFNIILIMALVFLWRWHEEQRSKLEDKLMQMSEKYVSLLEKTIAAIQQANATKTIEEAIRDLRREK